MQCIFIIELMLIKFKNTFKRYYKEIKSNQALLLLYVNYESPDYSSQDIKIFRLIYSAY